MKCIIVIKDYVNCKLEGLDKDTRKKIVDKLKIFVPYAKYTPTYKLGRWDGTVSFASLSGNTFINLLDIIIPIIIEDGYEIEIDDKRKNYDFNFPEITEDILKDRCWPAKHPLAGQPIMLRDYQVKLINTYLKEKQCILMASTGSGKTAVTAAISLLCEPYGRSIVVVPSTSLVIQTEEVYKQIGLDVGVYMGSRKDWNNKHIISTWQSLSVFDKNSKKCIVDKNINEYLEGMICVQCDEAHSAKATVLRDLLTGPFANIPIRVGLTGTIPKENHERYALISAIGPIIDDGIKAKDLQNKGVLAKSNITIIQTQEEYDFKDYQVESNWLQSDLSRLKFMASYIEKLKLTGNTLVLINKIECGKKLEELIKDSKFISGKNNLKERTAEYNDFGDINDKTLICTYGIASTGINIIKIDNLVLIEAGKSFTKVIQSIGRGLRKGYGKETVEIYDICSKMKFSKRHLNKRKIFYDEAEYKYTLNKVKY